MSIHIDPLPALLGTLLIAGGAGTLGATVLRPWLRARKHEPLHQDLSLAEISAVAAYYTAGHQLINTGSGLNDGIRYGMYLTTEAEPEYGPAHILSPTVLYVLNLPFNTQAHLIGVGRKYPIKADDFEAFLATTGMAKVTLDYDLAQHVTVYTDSHIPFQSQYPLDPDALAFVKKYCKDRLWELHDSELYFAVPEAYIGKGNFITEGHLFAQAIRPTLPPGSPDALIVHRELPYDLYDGPILACPVCTQKMTLHDDQWFMCPEQHGILLSGKNLDELSTQKFRVPIDPVKTVHHGPLTCPRCEHPMLTVLYYNMQIDSCSNCSFHWLDANEAALLSPVVKK